MSAREKADVEEERRSRERIVRWRGFNSILVSLSVNGLFEFEVRGRVPL